MNRNTPLDDLKLCSEGGGTQRSRSKKPSSCRRVNRRGKKAMEHLALNDSVQLIGLQAEHLNGLHGFIQGYDAEAEKYVVGLTTGGTVRAELQNLQRSSSTLPQMLSRGGSSSSSVWMNSHGELVSRRSSSFGIPPPPPPPSAGSRLPPPPPPPRATAGLQSPSSAELLLAPPDAQPPPLPAVFSAQRSSRVPSGMLRASSSKFTPATLAALNRISSVSAAAAAGAGNENSNSNGASDAIFCRSGNCTGGGSQPGSFTRGSSQPGSLSRGSSSVWDLRNGTRGNGVGRDSAEADAEEDVNGSSTRTAVGQHSAPVRLPRGRSGVQPPGPPSIPRVLTPPVPPAPLLPDSSRGAESEATAPQLIPPKVPSLAEIFRRSMRLAKEASSAEEIELSDSDEEDDSSMQKRASGPVPAPPVPPKLQTEASRQALAARIALVRGNTSNSLATASQGSPPKQPSQPPQPPLAAKPPSPEFGIRLASADAPPTLPSLQLGKAFKIGHKRGMSAFGAPLQDYATVTCYGCEVPTVIVMLWIGLVVSDGIAAQGIFRLAPDPKAALAAEKQLSKGCLQAGHPPEVLAHLMKSFLRRLPGGLLGRPSLDTISDCVDAEGYADLCHELTELERSLLEWLVRVVVEVAGRQDENKMTLRNLTLVIAPNLRNVSVQPPATPTHRTGGFFGAGTRKQPAAPATCDPLEELMSVESTSTALHTLAAASMRCTL